MVKSKLHQATELDSLHAKIYMNFYQFSNYANIMIHCTKEINVYRLFSASGNTRLHFQKKKKLGALNFSFFIF
jgi:hypothetical protein